MKTFEELKDFLIIDEAAEEAFEERHRRTKLLSERRSRVEDYIQTLPSQNPVRRKYERLVEKLETVKGKKRKHVKQDIKKLLEEYERQ